MMRVVFACVLFCVLCVSFPFLTCAADGMEGVRLLRMQTLVDVLETDAVDVTEKTDVEVLPGSRSHGLERDVSVRPRWKDLARRDVRLTVLEALLDGRRISVNDTETDAGVCRIHLRDRTKYLSPGLHSFLVKYRLTRQTGFGETEDSLQWSVPGIAKTGTGSALCAVLLPEGTGAFSCSGSLTAAGGKSEPAAADCVSVNGRSAYVFRTHRALAGGENLAVSVSWPSGLVERPAAVRPEDDCGFTRRLAVLFLAVLAVCLLTRYALRRAGSAGFSGAADFPPKNGNRTVSPACADYALHGGKMTSAGMAGLLLSLIGQGCLAVKDEDGLCLRKTGKCAAHAEEQAGLAALPEACRLDGSFRSHAGRICAAAGGVLAGFFPEGRGIRLALGLLQCLAALAGVIVLLCLHCGAPSSWVPDAAGALACGAALAACGAAALLFLRTRKGPARFLWGLFLAAVPCALGFWLAGSASGRALAMRLGSPFWLVSPLQSLFALACVLAPFACFPGLSARPLRLAALKKRLEGFRGFMKSVEAAPQEQYMRFMPYAPVFGLAQAWRASGEGDADSAAPLDRFASAVKAACQGRPAC